MLLGEPPRLAFALGDEEAAIRRIAEIPRRNSMAPPELARDAPGLDVLEPAVIVIGEAIRDEARLAVLDGRERRLRQLTGVDVPLVREPRLDGDVRAVAVRDRLRRGLDLFEQAQRFEIGDDALPGFEAIEAAIGSGHLVVELGEGVEDVDLRQSHGGGRPRSR